jgi:hypothetical protein
MNDSAPKKSPLPLFIAGVVVLAVFLGIVGFMIANGITNSGNTKQEDLIARYNDTTNVLSDCLVKTKQSVGTADANTDALDRVITNAVRGRYTEGSTAQPGNGALFSAIKEAYPDTQGLSDRFGDVMIVINGCRTDFKNSQSVLQNDVADFNKWRTGSFTVRNFGGNDFPSEALEITVNDKPVTGMDALRQMRKLVVVSEAQTGRDTNQIENVNPFDDSTN